MNGSGYMSATMQISELGRSTVPVSRFKSSEAIKIFDEVSHTGIVVAVNDNKPACILISPKEYESIMEKIEDLELMVEAEKRITEGGRTYSQSEVMQSLGITQDDIDAAEDVEIE
jgi:PHD/YefM family antitoxin component YafN of YafNO toxin-antitoxin module